MANRVFVSAIVVLWLSSMTWLFVERILPSFIDGQPPVSQSYKAGEVIAWSVEWGGKPVGFAASVRIDGVGGTTELHNHILLKDAPLMELAPAWMRHAVGNLGNMSFDAKTRIEFDSLDNFSAFESSISLNEMPSVLSISGRVKDSELELEIRSGEISYPTSVYLPEKKSLSEALFPDARLPLMYEGRRWREEVFSPFHSPSDPVEVVEAEVVSEDSMEYQGEIRRLMRVEYRSKAGSGVSKKSRLQAVSWVEKNGTVLRREVYVGSTKMRFDRLSKAEAAKVGVELFEILRRQGAEIETPELPEGNRDEERSSAPEV